MKIEERTSNTVLGTKIKVNIGGSVYQAPAPTLATLLRASALISVLPEIKNIDSKDFILESLFLGKYAREVAKIIALFICGEPKVLNFKDKIKRRLLERKLMRSDISDIKEAFVKILNSKQIQYFFEITISLLEINMLRKTREMVTETTASGLQ